MVSDDDVVTIGDTSDAPVIIGEELVGLETAQESDNIAIAALLAVAVLWGTNFPAVRYLVTDPVSLTPAAYSFARFGASALALFRLAPASSSKGALLAGAECGLWIAAGYVVQCLALQGTTAAKGVASSFYKLWWCQQWSYCSRPSDRRRGKQPTMKDWVCAGAALAGVALLELTGLDSTRRVGRRGRSAARLLRHIVPADCGGGSEVPVRRRRAGDGGAGRAVAAVASIWLLGAEGRWF